MLRCDTHSHSRHVAENSECVHFNTRGLTASMCNNYVASLWETNVKQMSQNFNSEHFGLTNTASCSVGGDIFCWAKTYFFILAFHWKLGVKAVFKLLLLLLLQVEHCRTLGQEFGDTRFPLWTAPSTGKKVSSKTLINVWTRAKSVWAFHGACKLQ